MQSSFAILLFGFAGLVCGPAGSALAQEWNPAREWKLKLWESEFALVDRLPNEIETYGLDRESVKVAWTAGRSGDLLVTCGITTTRFRGHDSTACWYMAKHVVDRITEDSGSVKHRLYHREISEDGKAMTLTWSSEEGRTKVISVRTFDRLNR